MAVSIRRGHPAPRGKGLGLDPRSPFSCGEAVAIKAGGNRCTVVADRVRRFGDGLVSGMRRAMGAGDAPSARQVQAG